MRGSRRLAGALAALALGVSASAFAQPAAAPPGGPPPDAERLALAQQIYQLMGTQTLGATTGALKTMFGSMMAHTGGADSAHAQAVQAALSDSIDKMIPRVLQGTVQIMAQDFTADQLRGMLAFYRSPTGQAALQKMPEITAQSIRLSQSLIPQMLRDFEADYCRRITCSDKEQQAFAQVNARMSQSFAAAPPSP